MTKPITIEDAEERGLLAFKPAKGIATFSNSDHWDSWASVNCFVCRFYDPNKAGALCAFEGAALIGLVSPDLARMFGWIENEKYPGEFDEPQECAFLKRRDDHDDDHPRPPAPDLDPLQLVLIADPTEDASVITQAEPAPAEVLT